LKKGLPSNSKQRRNRRERLIEELEEAARIAVELAERAYFQYCRDNGIAVTWTEWASGRKALAAKL